MYGSSFCIRTRNPRRSSSMPTDALVRGHVALYGLGSASDTEIWAYATAHERIIVSKDADFAERSLLRGAPPKIIWLRLGNASVADTATVLDQGRVAVHRCARDREASLLVLPLQLLP